jgi:hypothetical protein
MEEAIEVYVDRQAPPMIAAARVSVWGESRVEVATTFS